jgi:hypothetical protein
MRQRKSPRQRISLRDIISAMTWDPNLRRKGNDLAIRSVAEETKRPSRVGRTVRGTVTSAGAAGGGSGDFSSVKDSTGDYTVTFVPPLAGTPTVVITISSAVVRFFSVGGISAAGFSVNTKNSAEVDADAQFDFIAIG